MDEPEEDRRGILIIAKDALIAPFHIITSKPAQRAYLSTTLLLAASLLLFVSSIIAYFLFYTAYIPRISFSRTLHLQFPVSNPTLEPSSHPATHPWPYGVAELHGEVVSQQPYDISLELWLPRSPGNLALGNFMLDLELLGATAASAPSPASHPLHPDAPLVAGYRNESAVLARSSRPATLTYYSPVVDGVGVAAGLPLYAVGWKKEEEKLEVGMMEGVEFRRGWGNVPRGARVVVRTDGSGGGRLQVYGCEVKFVARFGGLRWFMYQHRILSFLFFTTIFWVVSQTTTLLAYLTLSRIIFPTTPTTRPVKHERPAPTPIKPDSDHDSDTSNPSLSDTSRTFPTLRHQSPLHFSASTSARIKSEPSDRDHDSGLGSSLPEEPGARSAPSGPSAPSSSAGAAQRYPTPEVDLEREERESARRLPPETPGDAADDEEDADADFVEDDLREGEGQHGERGGGSGADLREDVRESVRRRRRRLFARGGQDTG
ncbi:MAG: hypothetical protein Q9165_001090 [Trypethelium subeluteriae]